MPDPTANLLIVSFTPFPAPTGPATRLAQRIAAFANAGWHVEVLTPKTDDLPHVSKYAGARIFRVPMPQHRSSVPGARPPSPEMPNTPATLLDRAATFERALRRQLQGTDYDGIYVLDAFSSAALTHASTIPIVVYEAAGDPFPAGGDSEWSTAIREREAALLRHCAAVVVPTEEAARRMRSAGASPDMVHVVRPCADLRLFEPPAEGRRWRSKPVRIVVAASALQPQELSLLAEALLILPTDFDVRVTVSAHVTPDARTRILAESVLRDRLDLRDPVLYDDLPPLYQEADIGLVVSKGPSESGRLQTIAEMMATGLATILPDIPAVREIVTPGDDALLVPPADVEALVHAIEGLLVTPERCVSLGSAARARAEQLLDESSESARLIRVVSMLLAPHIGPRSAPPDSGDEPTPAGTPRLRGAASTATTVPGRSQPPSGSVPSIGKSGSVRAVDPHDEVTSPETRAPPAEASPKPSPQE